MLNRLRLRPAMLVFCGLLALATGTLRAQGTAPAVDGPVRDFAGLIPAGHEARIAAIAREVRAKCGSEIVVATIPTLHGAAPDQAARELAARWGVGRASEGGDPARNTGLLILLSADDRRVGIAGGAGTTEFIRPGEAAWIARDELPGTIARRGVGPGLVEHVERLAGYYGWHYGFELASAPGAVAAPLPSWAYDPLSPEGALATVVLFVAGVAGLFLLARLLAPLDRRVTRYGIRKGWVLPEAEAQVEAEERFWGEAWKRPFSPRGAWVFLAKVLGVVLPATVARMFGLRMPAGRSGEPPRRHEKNARTSSSSGKRRSRSRRRV